MNFKKCFPFRKFSFSLSYLKTTLLLVTGLFSVELAAQQISLDTYWSYNNTDYSSITRGAEAQAYASEYTFVRNEGMILANDVVSGNTKPLKLYWHPGRGDFFSTATGSGESAAKRAGYQFIKIQGYVFDSKIPGSIPLKLFWHYGQGDNFTTASEQGEADALASGYKYIRIEGYILSGNNHSVGDCDLSDVACDWLYAMSYNAGATHIRLGANHNRFDVLSNLNNVIRSAEMSGCIDNSYLIDLRNRIRAERNDVRVYLSEFEDWMHSIPQVVARDCPCCAPCEN